MKAVCNLRSKVLQFAIAVSTGVLCLLWFFVSPSNAQITPDQAPEAETSSSQTADEEPPSSKPNTSPQPTPSPEEIVNHYIQARGGYEILQSMSSVHVQYSASNSGQPFRYEIFCEPGKYRSYSLYPSGKTFERGIKDGISWTCSNGQYRQLFGDELSGIVARHQHLVPATQWLETCKSIKFISTKTVEKRKTHQLHFLHDDGREADKFFDVETGFLLRTVGEETHGASTHVVTRNYSDFKQFGDLTIPKVRTIFSLGRTYIYTVESYDVDVSIDSETFDLPDMIVQD